jgi:hypothetical protein
MKFEIGMYVRTDKGFIAQIKEFKEHYTKGKRLEDGCSVKEVVENYLSLDGDQCRLIESIDYSIPPCYPSDEELDKIKRHIVKTSHNIIDLIEIGDYVNGKKIVDVGCLTNGPRKGTKVIDYYITPSAVCYLENEDIKSIVTKELFEIAEYRIGE